MTPPPAVADAAGTLPRRRSVPPRTEPRSRSRSVPAGAPRRAPSRPPAPARIVQGVLDAPLLDRLVRGSGWIPLVAVGLMGIVFMQVSMLKLNAGIGRAVTTADTLERQNSELRSQVSRLDGNARIESAARRAGMVVPSAGSFRYVTARPGRTDAREAARGIAPPSPVQPGSTPTAQQQATAGATAPAAATTTAPETPATPPAAQTTTPATDQAAPPTTQATPQQSTTPPTAAATTSPAETGAVAAP